MYLNNKNFIKNYIETEKNIEETRLYFLILGCLFPFTEVFIELFNLRLESELIANIGIGLTFLIIYFLSKKSPFLQKHINQIFNFLFLLISVFVVYKSIFKPFEAISFSEFLIIVFFVYLM